MNKKGAHVVAAVTWATADHGATVTCTCGGGVIQTPTNDALRIAYAGHVTTERRSRARRPMPAGVPAANPATSVPVGDVSVSANAGKEQASVSDRRLFVGKACKWTTMPRQSERSDCHLASQGRYPAAVGTHSVPSEDRT
jgi:hypothetical protein